MNYSGVRNNSGVREESLRCYVPSLFAAEPHASRSERYAYIPTWETLTKMQQEGFIITFAQQAKTRDASKREFTKHLVRLRHKDDIAKAAVVGDSVFELLLKNAHDGSSLYELMGGCYRFVCANGMIVGEHVMPALKVKHSGNITDNVIEGSYRVISDVPKLRGVVDAWKTKMLTVDQMKQFAEEAGKLRFNGTVPVTNYQLLAPRRCEDSTNNLWYVFNRVQENLMKGGMIGNAGTRNARAVRSIKGIDQDLKLNKGLWEIAERYAA